jgi:suppressor of cytokine signaling 2
MPSTADGDVADENARWQRDAADAKVFDGIVPSYSRVANFLPVWDLERLKTVYFRLAVCGFYYGRMSIDEAAERLCKRPVGTFLVRDSADSRFLLSVSVETCRGPTSIRIAYRSGLFRLNCTPDQEHLLPTFDCAVRLICHYVRLCSGNGYSRRKGRTANSSNGGATSGVNSYVFLESSGRRDTPVLLRSPFRERPQRLGQLCRRAIHSAVGLGPVGADVDRESAVDRLPLVPSLKTYLKDYPYDL